MAHHIAFEREALPFLGALQHFAQQLCGDEQFANDLVQETMLKALRSFHTYRQGTNCRAWLFQICKNSYINAYRRKQYETIAVDFEEEGVREGRMDDVGRALHPIAVDEKSGEFQHGALGDEVAEALESIPAEYQTVLILSDIEGFTYEEIASLVHAPIGTVRSRIHRGRKQLAHRLTAYALRNGCSVGRFSA
jgi:RNA polymerase sigma-70 factor (ECF subfamily)